MALAPGEHLDVRPISVFLPPGRRLRNDLRFAAEYDGEAQMRRGSVRR